jgi:hypothetical protein
MPRSFAALVVVAIFLAACGGSESTDSSPLSAQPCTSDLCGAPGTPIAVQLTDFNHATDLLQVAIGASTVTLVIDANTHPQRAHDACADDGHVGRIIAQWNSTAPMNPFGHFDVAGDREPGGSGSGAYHRVLVSLAQAGAQAVITVAENATTVATLQPVCPAAS